MPGSCVPRMNPRAEEDRLDKLMDHLPILKTVIRLQQMMFGKFRICV